MSTPPRVLIVEDNPSITVLFMRLLRGFTVVASDNAEKALNLLAKYEFDLVLLDIHLGHKPDGLDILRAIHDYKLQLNACCAVISADDSMRGEAERLGCDLWMTKPVDVDTFAYSMQTCIAVEGSCR